MNADEQTRTPSNGPRFVVTQGIGASPDAPWFTAERRPNGSLRRVCSPALPLCATQREAEDNLLAWLGMKVHLCGPSVGAQYSADYNALVEKRRSERGEV